LAYSFSSPLR